MSKLANLLTRLSAAPKGLASRFLPQDRVSGRLLRAGELCGKSRLRGFWEHSCYAPLRVSDPERLIAVSANYGGLSEPALRRLWKQATVAEKRVGELVARMLYREDRESLAALERILFGGGLKWAEGYENLVVNEGLNHLLDVTLSGAVQDTSWFIGLLGASPTPAATDTATQVAGYDFISYDEATLPAFTDGGVSGQSVDNVGNEAVFTISANSSTIGGAFLIGTNARDTPAGTLYAAGAFTGGNKSADDNDTLEVSATFTAAAA